MEVFSASLTQLRIHPGLQMKYLKNGGRDSMKKVSTCFELTWLKISPRARKGL